jgi:hypothetical protein
VFIPDVPEFLPVTRAAGTIPTCTVHPPRNGYWRIEGRSELRFQRKELGLGPALWNSMLSGGFCGHIVEYGRDILRIQSVGPEETK